MRQLSWLWCALVILTSSLGFAVLITVKFHTSPQCFYVFYLSHANELVSDWSFGMLAFFVSTTSLVPAAAIAFVAWGVLMLLVKIISKTDLKNALSKTPMYASPAALLIVPALFWSDVPGTNWMVHQSFHDGRGTWPFNLLRPVNVGLLTALSLALCLSIERFHTMRPGES